jgi:ketosteroid isomerase-like protein
MNARLSKAALVCITMFAVGCAAAPNVDLEAERAAALQVGQQFQDGMNASNVDAVLGLYASEFILMPNATETIRTTDALRTYLTGFTQAGIKDLKITSEKLELASSGDLAVDVGTYAGTAHSPAGPSPFNGRYVVVLKKIDGAWKLVLDMDNLPIAPPPAAPTK